MPALAVALRDGRTTDPVVSGALAEGRLRVGVAHDPWSAAVDEIRVLRGAGHSSVGVFVSQRVFVEELARALADAGIEHEIAGLDAAAGEAQAAIAAMARFAVGEATWDVVRQRLAVFLVAAQPRRSPPPLAISLLQSPNMLPAPVTRRLGALEDQLRTQAGEPVGELFRVAGDALSIFGWGQALWRLGTRDLYGQALDMMRRPLDTGTAEVLARVADRRRSDSLASDLGSLRLPVRLMTMHQAKGREMDAILVVHHPDDYLPEPLKHRRVLFVSMSRARRTVAILVPPAPHALYTSIASLAS